MPKSSFLLCVFIMDVTELPTLNSFKEACASFLEQTKQMSTTGRNKTPLWFGEWTTHLEKFLGDTAGIIQSLEERDVKMTSKLAVQSTISDRLVDQVHELRQYSRRTNLLIHGIDEEENTDRNFKEDTDGKVVKIAHERLGLRADFVPKDISRSHRLGKRQNGKKRPIIVRFTSYRAKKMMFDKKKDLKNSGISITENLSPERYELYKKCWDIFGKENCWTLDGRINCLLQEQGGDGRRKLKIVTKDSDLVN